MVVQTARDAAKVRFDERGLVPCVMQDARSGEVLTLAYMDENALQLTLETREIHFYSRSRREIWRKGGTSGNIQRVRQIRYDCDGDALVALVDPAGPERTLVSRQRSRPDGSYTVELLEDPRLAADKVREEANEVVKAVHSESEERVAEEGADVVYHLAVLLLSRGLSMAEVLHVLNGRRRSR
jgi:phosphoribosyl-ATP pyrophosphohydrolase/phosphoribosyl-AMP cyclohydrolase